MKNLTQLPHKYSVVTFALLKETELFEFKLYYTMFHAQRHVAITPREKKQQYRKVGANNIVQWFGGVSSIIQPNTNLNFKKN